MSWECFIHWWASHTDISTELRRSLPTCIYSCNSNSPTIMQKKKKMIKLEIINKWKVFRISWRVRVIFYNCYIYLALNCWKCRLLILKMLFTGRFPTKRNVTFLKIQFCTLDLSLQCINLIIEDYERTCVLLTGDLQ